MHEAFWNGLLDVRWEDAPLGPETTRLVLRLRECGYAERTCRDYGHAVIHLGRVLREETGGVEGVRDDAVIEGFLGRHLPVCCCYRRPAGRRQEQVRRGLAHLRAMLREEGAKPEATVFGQRFKSSAAQAAHVNGIAAHAQDFDHSFIAGGQPTSPIIPAIFFAG